MSMFEKEAFPRPSQRRSQKGLQKRPAVFLGDVLSQVSRDLALDQKVNEMALLTLWAQVVEVPLRDRSLALRLLNRNGNKILRVKVKDAATAGELSFQIEAICEKLNQFEPQTGIRVAGLEIKIGSF